MSDMSQILNPLAPLAYLPIDVAQGTQAATYGTVGTTAVSGTTSLRAQSGDIGVSKYTGLHMGYLCKHSK